MDKMGKKLTDRELIDLLVSWYKLDHSSEQLREAVATYLRQNVASDEQKRNLVPSDFLTRTDLEQSDPVHSEPVQDLVPNDSAENEFVPSNLVLRDLAPRDVPLSKPKPVQIETSRTAPYTPQFEPTDELIGRRGWTIDAWALYYGTEEFFHRVSFGLVTMQTLAILFCIAISGAVMFGAWQSTLSTERQKKATFKSMVLDPAEKNRPTSPPPEQTASVESTEVSTPSTEPISASATADLVEPESDAGKPLEEPKNSIATSTSLEPPATDIPGSEFSPALDLIESALWDEAIENLKTLEKGLRSELQPLLTLAKIEALTQKHDAESMELARQLLMDCKCGELETVFDLLVTQWMLMSGPENRQRFLNEAASLSEAARPRMSTWAKIRNGDTNAVTEVSLHTFASKGPTAVCDKLFIASYYFNQAKYDDSLRDLLETKRKLLDLEATGKNSAENRLFEAVRSQLTSKVEEIINIVSPRTRKEIN